uniref:ParB/Sulfiredoxin domain-containing protein n=1 Tax=viral metagenome TaxID=1070528 RepID=A0A6C0KQT7_9ZZZZ
MEFIQDIKDSVETSVNMKLFSSLKVSSYHHIFNSNLVQFPLSKCRELHNFNPARLSNEPYPKNDRPRGQKDLDSVVHHRRLIRKQGHTEPIWILKKGDHILLDGAHRIVATYLENKRTILAYIITMD